jgi:uncharacterized DUF497 family protein
MWLEDIVEKLAERHDVQPQEVQEVIALSPYFRFVEKGHRPDENVYSALGRTEAGRCLTIFFVSKKDGRALILSARDMTQPERRRYGKK